MKTPPRSQARFPCTVQGSVRASSPGSARGPHAPRCGESRGAQHEAAWAAKLVTQPSSSLDPPPSENVPQQAWWTAWQGVASQAAGDLDLGLPWSGLSFLLCSMKGLGL